MADSGLFRIWVYLSTSPLLWLTATLTCYVLAYRIYRWVDANPMMNPVALAVAMLIALLYLTDTPYADYFDGAQFVHFLLGPATVSLAVPLYQQRDRLKTLWLPIGLAVVAGLLAASLSAVAVAMLMGAEQGAVLSLAPKSVTAPVAMGIAEKIGGHPSLTAVLVVMTGILGAVLGGGVFRRLGIEDDSIKGVAMGVTSHGIGTARAFQISREMGAFSGLAMALSAFGTAVLLPSVLGWLGLVP